MGNAFAKLLCVFSTLLRFRVHCEVRGKIIFATTLLFKKSKVFATQNKSFLEHLSLELDNFGKSLQAGSLQLL